MAHAGALASAEREYRVVIDGQVQTLGEADPATQASREEFVSLLRQIGKAAEADAVLHVTEQTRDANPEPPSIEAQ